MVTTVTPASRTAQLTTADQEFIRQVTARPRFRPSRAVVGLIMFGAASVTLYGIFFAFIDDLSALLTSGSIGGAVLVIGLALTFSLIHGSFANALLEVLGIRALKKG
jgi:hypothetical protein